MSSAETSVINLADHYREVRRRITRQGPPRAFAYIPKKEEPAPEPAPVIYLPKVRQPHDLFAGVTLSDQVKRAVAPILRQHGLTWAECWTKSRCNHWVAVRRDLWVAMRDAGLSLPRIGKLTNRDHSTVLHGLKEREKNLGHD